MIPINQQKAMPAAAINIAFLKLKFIDILFYLDPIVKGFPGLNYIHAMSIVPVISLLKNPFF